MTDPLQAEEPTPVVSTLIDYFLKLHPASRVRVTARAGGVASVVEPHEAGPLEDAAAGQIHLATLDHGVLRLEFVAGSAPPEEFARLADALRIAIQSEREARGAARELSDRYEEINLLYTISEISGSVVATEDAAARILAEILDVVGARRASLWINEPGTDLLELAATVGEPGLRGPIPIRDPDSATAWVFREKQPLNLESEPPGHGRPPGRPGPRDGDAFLSVPIHFTAPGAASRTVGVITLVGRRTGSRFTAGDERLVAAIASQIGAALEAHRLLSESLRQERILHELELAHDLQRKLLPDPRGIDGPARIAARCLPADSVGGDFFQVYRLSGERLGVLIGDVSGHGFPAALIMALTISAIGIYAQESEAPAEVLRRVHRAIFPELASTEMYLSLFYAVIDPADNRLRYANAGHPQAYRLTHDGAFQRLGATAPPLGTVPVEPYGERAIPWQHHSDLLVLFTDGLSDTFAAGRGSTAGEHAMLRRIAALADGSLDAIIADVFQASDHVGSNLPPDDRTLLLVRG